MTAAFSLSKILYDEEGQPADYIFVGISSTFSEVTGICGDILGKKASELEISWQGTDTDLMGAYADAALRGKSCEVRVFDHKAERWYRLSIYASAKEYFLTLVSDITEEIRKCEEINKRLKEEIFDQPVLIDHIGWISDVADVIAEIFDRKSYLDPIQHRETRLESILNILEYKTDSVQEFLDNALDEVIMLTHSKIGYIYFYDEANKEFILNSWSKDVLEECKIVEQQTRYRLEKTGLWGEAVRQRKPIIENDFQRTNSYKKGYPEGHVQLYKFLTVPIFFEEHIVAVVAVANKKTDYDQDDILNISLVMNSIWKTVEIRRMHQLVSDSEERSHAEKEQLRITLQSIGDGVISTDRYGNVMLINGNAETLIGWIQKEAVGRCIRDVFHIYDEDTGASVEDMIEQVLKTGNILRMKNNKVLVARDGTRRTIENSVAPIKDKASDILGVVIVFRDVTEEKRQLAEIKFLSMYDKLTGLYNRAFFEEILDNVDIASKLPLSVIMGDINGLKLTNDVFGHQAGDQLLINVAQILKKSCHAGDIVARLGGDEFIILLPNTSNAEVCETIKRIQNNIAAANNQTIKMSVALGSATKEKETEKFTLIFKKAEDRMYRRKLLESKSLRSSYVFSLQETLFQKNFETYEHAERLKLCSQKIALELGLLQSNSDDLELLSLLHDVGKIAISDSILLKPGKLTEEEWVTMKRHSEIGYRIARNIAELSSIADYILCHHERWDGKGYPQGLKGEEIPRLARIISVVDAYDAMTHNRLYRDVLTHEEAIKEICNNAGTQFDPEIVQIFCRVV